MASILWISDSPSRLSGFGITTRNICTRLAARGHQVHALGWWCTDEHAIGALSVFPCPISPSSAVKVITEYLTHYQPDWVVTFADVPWVGYMATQNVQDVLRLTRTRWIHYYPVDSTLTNGALPEGWVRILSRVAIPIVMSEFGRVASARSGIDAVLIPQGVDPGLFSPPVDKVATKRKFNYTDKFVVLSDIRNHRRKLIPRILDVAASLREAGNDILLHLHTNLRPQEDLGSYRYDLWNDVLAMGLEEMVRISNADPPGLSWAEMAELYRAADVHLLLSWGEGFGLPTLQAAASGTVPTAPANSANVELVSGHGVAIPCDGFVIDEFGLLRGYPSRDRARDALLQLRSDAELLRLKSQLSRGFALQFDWEVICSIWDSLLGNCNGGRIAGHILRERTSSTSSKPHYFERLDPMEIRPSGHHCSELPVPRIGIPTRIRQVADDGAAIRGAILADSGAIDALRGIEKLFPGTTISGLSLLAGVSELTAYLISHSIILVVLADPLFLDGLDVACAVAAINFVGPSRIWPATRKGNIFSEARFLLTDFAAAERRLAIARSHLAMAELG